ncbi:MAG: hypothetical protein ABWY20_15850 [Mycobacterium sp.]
MSTPLRTAPDLDPGDNTPQTEAAPPARRQVGSLIEVILDGREPFEVTVDNRDRIAWDKTSARHSEWPAATARSFVMTFLTWNACRREQLIERAVTFEQFQELLLDWNEVEQTAADPTQ